jgi:predicted amidophosphoribosyltransferase
MLIAWQRLSSGRGVLAGAVGAVRALGAALWPMRCARCDVRSDDGEPLCVACEHPWRTPTRTVVEGTTSMPGGVVVVAGYAGPVARTIVVWKDGGRRDLTPMLARALSRALTVVVRAWGCRGAETVVVVPVPSRRSAVRRRGEDRVAELARLAVRRFCRDEVLMGDVPRIRVVRRRWVRLDRAVRDQAGLGVEARAVNMRGAMALRWRAHGEMWWWRFRRRADAARIGVVIVDDVVTTGASVREMRRCLGCLPEATVIGVAALSRTLRRRPGPSSDQDAFCG